MAIIFFLSYYGNNGGKEGRLWHNVGRKPHYMAIYFAEPLIMAIIGDSSIHNSHTFYPFPFIFYGHKGPYHYFCGNPAYLSSKLNFGVF